MHLLYIGGAWVGGILLGAKMNMPVLALLAGLVPFSLILLFPHKKKFLVVIGLCLLALIGGILRFPPSQGQADEHSLSYYNDQGTIVMQGTVADEPDTRDSYTLLKISSEVVTVQGETREVTGKALVRVTRYPEYHYGDVLSITGKLETPPQFADFDYRAYLAQQGIYSLSYYPYVTVVSPGQGASPLAWLYSVREKLSQPLAKVLPEPQGALAQAIVLGMRGGIPDEIIQEFSRTGTAHLLAISGLHIAIVIGMVLSLGIAIFGRRRYTYIWLALLAIWLYVALTGMHVPVIRGAIMGSLFLLAEALGRQRSAIIALGFAAAVMVAIDPNILWSVSFQMSFLAMAGLIFLFPYFRRWGRMLVSVVAGDRPRMLAAVNVVSDSFAVTLSAVIAVCPLVSHYFGVISTVALPSTFLALPALPAIIVTSGATAIVGIFSLALAQPLGWISWLFLSYLLLVVHVCDALPFSSFTGSLPTWSVLTYYGAMVATIIVFPIASRFVSQKKRFSLPSRLAIRIATNVPRPSWPRVHSMYKWILVPLLITTILVWSACATLPDGKLHVSFLDVGQGDSILVQTPHGQNILIDGGPSPQQIDMGLSQHLAFWDRNIDLMISTQPQADHLTGLVEVLQRYKVKRVLEPGVPYDSLVYNEWCQLIADKGIQHDIATAGQEIDLGDGITMEVLNPQKVFLEGSSDDVDNNDIVLRLSWGEVSFLFTADIRTEAELELILQRANIKTAVLKVGHHGSKTSTSPGFLAAVDPEIAVISVGEDNPFGHPSPQVVERLEEKIGQDNLYLTSQNGTIEFTTDGKSLWVKTER